MYVPPCSLLAFEMLRIGCLCSGEVVAWVDDEYFEAFDMLCSLFLLDRETCRMNNGHLQMEEAGTGTGEMVDNSLIHMHVF